MELDVAQSPIAAVDDTGMYAAHAEPGALTNAESISGSTKHEDTLDRLRRLFDELEAPRPTMVRILEMCSVPQPVDDVNAMVRRREGDHAVFDGPVLCNLLFEAGALERIEQVTQDSGEKADVVAGEMGTYLKPAAAHTSVWKTTSGGALFLEIRDSDGPIRKLEESEPEYWPIYKELFRYVSDGGGHCQSDVADYLAGFEPFMAVCSELAPSHLLDQAQRAGAIEWEDGWHVTEVGRRAGGC